MLRYARPHIRKEFRKAVRVRSSALWTEAGPTGYGCRVDVFLPSQPLGSEVAGAKAGPTASGPSGRWRWEVGSCRVAGGDGTLAKVDFGAPRRRRPRTPAPPKPPKRCPYQRPGPESVDTYLEERSSPDDEDDLPSTS